MKQTWDYPGNSSPFPRILSLLAPHGAFLALASVSAALFAVLDASVYVLMIPFVETLFSSAGGPGFASETGMDRLLDATVYRWVDLAGDPLEAIGQIIALIILVFLVKNVFHFSRTYLVARVEQEVNRSLRNQIYGHLVGLDLSFFGRTRLGQVVSRLTTEVEQFRRLVTTELFRVLSSGLEFSVAVIAMLLISWQLTAAAFVVVPLAMIFWGPLVGVLRRLDHKVLHLGGEVTAHVQETFAAIRLVKSSSSENRERERFRSLTGEYFQQFMRAEFVRSLAPPLTELLAAAGTVVILWLGARFVVAGEITGPEFVGFLGLSVKLYSPVKNVAKFPAVAQPGLVAAERIFDFLDTPCEICDASGASSIRGFESTITFEDVSFSYRAHEVVLRGISLHADRGDVIALVGPSGAGKSTLVDLLGRFFDVDTGRILVDGVDIRGLRIGDLRSLFGIVSQDTVLFHDTVRANIAYGRPEASHADIVAAATAAHAHVQQFMRAEFVRSLAPPLTELLAAAGTVVILWLGARFVVAGEITGPEFVGFLGLSVKLYSPVKNVAKFPAVAQPGLVAAERIFDFLDTPCEICDASGASSIRGFESTITFEDVSFSYRAHEVVLRGISLHADRGDVIALVGPSGAGKSTLVDLLGRFFDVDTGRILVDGVDIRGLRIGDLRSLFGIVSQDTVLFHDTVRANIAYGRPEASHADIVAAATAAHAHDFITEMPKGYDTIVGERGVELSGGERQRIAIARALLMNRPILVLDEATSSLDTASERVIQEATSRLMVGRTVFVIAHRLSTILSADKILVMDGGEIIEQGDHGTLMAKAGLYRRLYDLQFNEAAAVGSLWPADET